MTFEIPTGWNAQDIVQWNLNLRLNPMSYSLTTGSPDHRTWISYLSGLTFDFQSNGYGGVLGKAPPQKPSDFLVQNFKFVHPNTEFDVVDVVDQPIPFPYRPGASNVFTSSTHSVLTARFEVNGTPMEERLSMDFYGWSMSTGPNAYRGNWFVSGLTVVNAPEGQLPAAQQVCNTVLNSERMAKSFSSRYQQVCSTLLAKTKAEGRAMQQQKARRIIRGGGGGGHAHIMNKDEFELHEAIKGLRSRIFSRSIGN